MNKLIISIIILITCGNIQAQNIYDGLVGYWPMNCTAEDSLGVGIDGEIVGSPNCVAGKLDESLNFKEGDYINLPTERSLEMVSSKGFTWSLWFKLDSLPVASFDRIFQTFISFADNELGGDVTLGIGSLTTPQNEFAFVVDGPGGVANSASSRDAVLNHKPANNWQKDTWYHVAGLRDYENNKVELYFQGIKVDSATFNVPIEPFSEPQVMKFARFDDGETTGNNFTGGLDEIRIYDRVLTESEVLILFSARPEQLSTQNDSINFSNIKCEADSTILVNIRNEGPSEFVIQNFEFKNGEAFSLRNPEENFTLQDGQIYPFGIKFEPPTEGKFYDTLFVNNAFGVQPLIIYLEGEKEVLIDLPSEIDFGELVSCQSNTFLEAGIEINNLNITDGLVFKGIELQNGEVTSGTYNALGEGGSSILSLTFTPTESGTFSQTGMVVFENCDLTYPIEVKANYTYLEKTYQEDFNIGNQEVGIEKIETLSFSNTGTTDLNISGLEILDENSQFSINTSTFTSGLALDPNDEFNFDVSFLPLGGETSSTIVITTESRCGLSRDTIIISGNGKYRATLDMSIQEISANIGDEGKLNLELSNITNLDIAEIDSIYFQIDYNATVVNILNYQSSSSTISNWYKSASFTIQPNPTNDNQMIELADYRTTLGNESEPEISISNIEVYGGLATINQINSKVIINDLCDDGNITRLFIAEGWLNLGEVSPNPAKDKITFDFSLIEPGITSVVLYDNYGEKVETIFENEYQPGTYQIEYTNSRLRSGTYFYVLQTPTQTLSKKFFIVK